MRKAKKEEKRKGQAVSKVRPILLINESLVRRAAAKSKWFRS
jgi:hypothetical protein